MDSQCRKIAAAEVGGSWLCPIVFVVVLNFVSAPAVWAQAPSAYPAYAGAGAAPYGPGAYAPPATPAFLPPPTNGPDLRNAPTYGGSSPYAAGTAAVSPSGNPYASILSLPLPQNPAYVGPRLAQGPSGDRDTLPSSSDYVPTPVENIPAPGIPSSPSAQAVEEVPPLAVEDASLWYDPIGYFRGPCWETSLEVGVNGSNGNSETMSTRLGAAIKRESKRSKLHLDVQYNRATASDVETQNNALGEIRHDWLLGESRWSIFTNGSLEYDEFKSFDLRLAANAGLGYRLIDTDATELTGRFGSGVSHEIGGVNEDYVPEAVFGLDFEHCFSKRQKLTAKVDYFPAWQAFEDYRVVSDAGWEILLDEETNLSLKLAVSDRYDSTPDGLDPNDLNYSLLLLWKL